MNKLERYRRDEKFLALDDLCQVWGIGPNKAMRLFEKGIKTLDDLRKNQDSLTKSQRMGLKYIEEFRLKISYEEIEAILLTVRKEVHIIVGSSDYHFVEACGSFRRNKPFSSDIRILICRKDGTFEKELTFSLISQLKDKGLISDHLNIPVVPNGVSSITYMGVCQYKQQYHRRIDIKYCPIEEYPYALLHLTGSDYFNKSMRVYAKKKGYALTERGLTPLNYKTHESPPRCWDEKDIFAFLGL